MSKKRNFVIGFYEADGSIGLKDYAVVTYTMLKEAKETLTEWAEELDEDELDGNFIFELVPILEAKITPPTPPKKQIKWAVVGND